MNRFCKVFLPVTLFNIAFLNFSDFKAISSPLNCESEIILDSNNNPSKEIILCEESKSIDSVFNKVVYKNSYTQEESQLVSNQIEDFLGTKNLFKDKKQVIYGYPEQRISRDSKLLWKTYNYYINKQFNTFSKNTSDIFNGYDSSLMQ